MTASSNDQGDPDKDISSSEMAAFKKRLSELDHKLSDLKDTQQSERPEKSGGMMSSVAFKMASEFIAGPLAGGLLGWWIDKFFETKPLFLLILFLLGLAAGFLNVMRSARQMQESQKQELQAQQKNKDDIT